MSTNDGKMPKWVAWVPVVIGVLGFLGLNLPPGEGWGFIARHTAIVLPVCAFLLLLGVFLFLRQNGAKTGFLLGDILLGIVVVTVVAMMVSGVQFPWTHPQELSQEEQFLARMGRAQFQARGDAINSITAWTPESAGDIDFKSVSVTLDSEPMVRRDTAVDQYTKDPYSVTLIQIRGMILSSSLDHDVTFSFITPAPDSRPASRYDQDATSVPAWPLLFVAAPDGNLTRSGMIYQNTDDQSGESTSTWEWASTWTPGSQAPSVGLSYLQNDGSEVKDYSGHRVPTAWGQYRLVAPIETLERGTSDMSIFSTLNVTIPAGAQNVPADAILTFVIPSPPDYSKVAYSQTWMPLSQSGYPYLFGGLYLLSTDYTVVAQVSIGEEQ